MFIEDVRDFSSPVTALCALLGQEKFCKARDSDAAVQVESADGYIAVVYHLKEKSRNTLRINYYSVFTSSELYRNLDLSSSQ